MARVATVPPPPSLPADMSPPPPMDDRTFRTLDAAYRVFNQSGAPKGNADWWSNQNAMTISALVLLFGLGVIALATVVARRASVGEALRLYGTIMVITMACFLVVAGYSSTQIAAPLGLLGTIVGYLLGRPTQPPADDDNGKRAGGDGGGDGA